MKVLLISGSPKPNGNTAQLLQECAKVVQDSGVEAEIISFAGMKIEACIACMKCAKTGECGLDDGLNEIIRKIKQAEGLIVGVPVYFGTARGDMMCALQRIGYVSRNNGGFLAGKIGGPIAVARRGGQTLTLQELLMFFLINDMIVPGSSLLEHGVWPPAGRSAQRRRRRGNHTAFCRQCRQLGKEAPSGNDELDRWVAVRRCD